MRYHQYFGQEVRRASFNGMVLTENAYEPNTVIPRHEHANPYFMLVVSGGLIERTCMSEFECGASALLFHREGARHANAFGASKAHCFGVEFDPVMLQRLEWNPHHDAPTTWRIQSAATVAIVYRLRQELQHADAVSPVMIEGLVLTLLGETARGVLAPAKPTRGTPCWLQAATEVIREEACEKISVTTIAGRVGVHPVTLARAYRAEFGTTVGEAIHELRLRRALRLLADPGLSITAVALSTGFSDHSHFTRSFRRHFGTTPQRFRAARANDVPAC